MADVLWAIWFGLCLTLGIMFAKGAHEGDECLGASVTFVIAVGFLAGAALCLRQVLNG